MNRRPIFTACRKPLLGACIGAALLTGCAGMQTGADCPNLSGTYANRAEGSTERLSALLMANRPGADAARSVTVSVQAGGDHRRLVVAAGSQQAALDQGSDFVCNAQGLRLLRPTRSGIDLGEVLVDELDTFYTLSRAVDGALLASTSAVEHAKIGGVPLSGPERRGTALRWKAIAPGSMR